MSAPGREGLVLRLFALSVAIGVTVVACVGDLKELYPPDGGYPELGPIGEGGTSAMDMTPAAAPKFYPDIQADIEALSCTSATCHGGTQTPVLKANPMGADRDMNYDNFKARAMTGMTSPVLVKNVPPGHSPGSPLVSTTSATYLRWLAWINGGHVKE